MDRLMLQNNEVIVPRLLLSNKSLSVLGAINNFYDLTETIYLNSANTISFSISKEDNIALWNLIIDDAVIKRLTEVDEQNEYYMIDVAIDETNISVKKVTGYALSESELSQLKVYNIEINTEADISREDYVKPTVLYSPLEPENSLLNRLLSDKAPHYKIGFVDDSIADLVRVFSFNNVSIYEAMTKTIATELNCIFIFNSGARSISVYDLENQCVACGERIGMLEVCPNCVDSEIIYGYGIDSGVFISTKNLATQMSLDSDPSAVKNTFRIAGGDDLINAAVRACNPSGTEYINYFSQPMKDLMPEILATAIDEYDVLYQAAAEQLEPLVVALYDAYDNELYYKTTMSPEIPPDSTTAQIQLNYIIEQISRISVLDLNNASESLVTNMIEDYANVIIYTGYKLTASNASYDSTTNIWTGILQVENVFDDSDNAVTPSEIGIIVDDNLEDYVAEKVRKILDDKDLDDKDLDWTKYSLDKLNSYYNAYSVALEALQELGLGIKTHEFYDELYYPYVLLLDDIAAEIAIREKQVQEATDLINKSLEDIYLIQDGLNFEEYLTNYSQEINLWIMYSSYRKEDIYTNTNYISLDLTNAEIVKKAQELIAVARKELYRVSHPSYQISVTMGNIFTLKDFEPFWEKFYVGNWVRSNIDGLPIKYRLISFSINYNEIQNSIVEFTDVNSGIFSATALEKILSQSENIASSYDSVKRQAEDAYANAEYVENWRTEGLDATNVAIVNNTKNQKVIIDELGILTQTYDPDTDRIGDEQLRITNGNVVITDDRWRSLKLALGKILYVDPITQETKLAYGINSEVLIGKLLLGETLIISNEGSNIILDKNGIVVRNDVSEFKVDITDPKGLVQINKFNPNTQMFENQLHVDTEGQLIFGDNMAYVNDNEFSIKNGEIREVLKVGNIAILPRTNGNTSFMALTQL